jgi:hypothetical protein
MATLFDGHHLIPTSLAGHPVFIALGNRFERFQLKLPNFKGAALASDSALMEARHATHIGEYTAAVKRYLDRFQFKHFDGETGQLNPGAESELIKDLQRLEARLADILTPSDEASGTAKKVVRPAGLLSLKDPRVVDGTVSVAAMRKFWTDLANDAVGDIDSSDFKQLDKVHGLLSRLNGVNPLDLENGTSGLNRAAVKQSNSGDTILNRRPHPPC